MNTAVYLAIFFPPKMAVHWPCAYTNWVTVQI